MYRVTETAAMADALREAMRETRAVGWSRPIVAIHDGHWLTALVVLYVEVLEREMLPARWEVRVSSPGAAIAGEWGDDEGAAEALAARLVAMGYRPVAS